MWNQPLGSDMKTKPVHFFEERMVFSGIIFDDTKRKKSWEKMNKIWKDSVTLMVLVKSSLALVIIACLEAARSSVQEPCFSQKRPWICPEEENL